jgi:hypothetical protein
MNNSKVKVKTAELLQAVRVRRAQMERDYENKVAKWNADALVASEKVAEALELKARDLRGGSGKLPDINYSKMASVYVGIAGPGDKPRLDTTAIDRLIKTLEIAAEPVLTISADDAARYLG